MSVEGHICGPEAQEICRLQRDASAQTASRLDLNKFVFQVGKVAGLTANYLLNFVERTRGDVDAVRRAVRLILLKDNQAALSAALGYRRPRSHHLYVAATVAAMNIGTSAVVASLLQEFVAHGVIGLKQVQEQFGSQVANLVDVLSRITKLPIEIRLPNSEGKLSIKDAIFNKGQEELIPYLFWLIEDSGNETGERENLSAYACLIKIADNQQQMRGLHKIAPASNARIKKPLWLVREEIVHNSRRFYLPLILAIGMQDFQEELQDMIIERLDPQAAKKIQWQLVDFGAQEKLDEGVVLVETALRKDGYGTPEKPMPKIIARLKRVYSTWESEFRKIFEKAVNDPNQDKMIEFSKLSTVDIWSKNDIMGISCITDGGEAACYALEKALYASDGLEVVRDRRKDFIKYPKVNDFSALLNTFRTIWSDGKISSLEVQSLDWFRYWVNVRNHGTYKGRSVLTKKGTSIQPIRTEFHPFYLDEDAVRKCRENGEVCSVDTINIVIALFRKGALPGPIQKDQILVADRIGALLPFDKGTTLRDILERKLVRRKRKRTLLSNEILDRPLRHIDELSDFEWSVPYLMSKPTPDTLQNMASNVGKQKLTTCGIH